MERNRTANLIAMIVAAILMVVLIVGHVRANQSQIFRMPEDGQLLTASVQGRNGPVEVEVAAGPTAFSQVITRKGRPEGSFCRRLTPTS